MWEEVVIDDNFPCTWGNRPAFNHSKKNELWVMILEKAWAKVHGGYLNINSGLTREALHDLTGAPAMTFFNDEGTDDERWNVIYESDRNNFIMCGGTEDLTGDGTDKQEKKTGIVANHAYSLLGATELVETSPGNWKKLNYGSHTNNKVQRLVKLRNPWGKGEWKGAWADDDSLWTASLKQELGHTITDDGVFWMPFEEFNKLFSDFQVCYYKDDYKYSSTRLNTQEGQHVYFEFDVRKTGDYYFSINQINKRFFKKDRNYKYSSCTITVGKMDGDQIIYVGATQKANKEAWFEATCTPGRYICSIYTPWISFVDEITLASYGPEEIQFNILKETLVPTHYYQKLVVSKANRSESDWKDFSAQGHARIRYKFEHGNDGFGFFCFENETTDINMTVTLEFTKC